MCEATRPTCVNDKLLSSLLATMRTAVALTILHAGAEKPTALMKPMVFPTALRRVPCFRWEATALALVKCAFFSKQIILSTRATSVIVPVA